MYGKIKTMLGFASKSGNICSGEELCRKGIISGKVSLLFMASDMSERTGENMKSLADQHGVKYIDVFTKDELSNAIGKSSKVLVGVTNKKFSREMAAIYEEVKNEK